MPCASLLVRIYHAPKTEDGLKVLSKADVEEKNWEKLGVWHPSIPYSTGKYNTSYCEVRDSEKELFILRQAREAQTTRMAATILMNGEGITDDIDDERILDWIDDKVIRTNKTEIIDLQKFAKYQPPSGFKFAVDGFHNVPEKIPYVALYCLNPPAALYNGGDTNLIHLNSNYDWESAVTTPMFLEGFVTFRDIKFEKNLTLLIDVRTVTFKKKGTVPVFKTIGWSALPVFSPDGYVQSGIYQLPVFDGAIPKTIVEGLLENDPWPFLMDKIKEKKPIIKYLEPMSVVVRLLDGQREGHFQKRFDFDRMDYKYLPEKRAYMYIYNYAVEARVQKEKRLSTIVPLKGDTKEYNKKVTEAFVNDLGLTQYHLK